VASALARDLCSWVQVLSNILVLPINHEGGATAVFSASSSAVEEKRSSSLLSMDTSGKSKDRGATVQRIAIQWPPGVSSGRVPRSVLESLEVAVRCSDKDTSSNAVPTLGKGKGSSSSTGSTERSPYLRTGPLSDKQRDRLAATHLAASASWIEARCLAPGRSYTVDLQFSLTRPVCQDMMFLYMSAETTTTFVLGSKVEDSFNLLTCIYSIQF